MAKSYYRSVHSGRQWRALTGKATELGCQITYSEYGIATIGGTDRESRITATTGRGGHGRAVWAERIRGAIQESTGLKACGGCGPRDATKAVAQLFAKAGERLSRSAPERMTGFKRAIRIMTE